MDNHKPGRTQPTELKDFFCFVVGRLSDQMCAHVDATYLKKHGLTIMEWRVLGNLGTESRLSARDIGIVTNMQKSTVSRAVKSLAERKLVAQNVAASDRRRKMLSLTARGRSLYETLLPELFEWNSEFLSIFSAKQRQELMSCLQLLSEHLRKSK